MQNKDNLRKSKEFINCWMLVKFFQLRRVGNPGFVLKTQVLYLLKYTQLQIFCRTIILLFLQTDGYFKINTIVHKF